MYLSSRVRRALAGARMTQMSLQRLSRREVQRMIHHLTGGKALPVEVLQRLMTRSDGIPLFVEELTKAVLESELLQEQEGAYRFGTSQSTRNIPVTLHDAFLSPPGSPGGSQRCGPDRGCAGASVSL